MNRLHRVLGLLLAFSLFAPALAMAQMTTGSTTVNVEIQALLSQITSLQQQLQSLVHSVVPTSTPPMWNASSTPPQMNGGGQGRPTGDCGNFARNLSVGSQGSDVSQLQQMLSGDGFLSASSTGFFGPLTAQALQSFQVHFGISASSSVTGFFGPLTRDFLNIHCGQGGNMSSSTPPSMHPMIPISTSTPFWGGPGPVITSSSTGSAWHGPINTGTSTAPHMPPPCPNNQNQGSQASLFVAHVILPMNPCQNGSNGNGPSGGQQ